MAGENPVVAMLDATQGGTQHRGDHWRLVPRGHQNGDEAGLIGARQFACEGAWVTAVDGRGAPQPPRKVDYIDEQVIGGEYDEADRREQSKLGGDAGEEFHRVHERIAPLSRRGGLE